MNTPHSSRKTGKEQFYTIPTVAQECIGNLLNYYKDSGRTMKLFLDPCAGNGVFSNYLKNFVGFCHAIDLHPTNPSVKYQDFLSYHPQDKFDAVITNPPFGRASNLAIKFFNHSCLFSDVVAFIVPKSWNTKFYILDKLNLNFHRMKSFDLPKIAFQTVEGEDHDGKYLNCVFQIWEKKDFERQKMLEYRSKDFEFIRAKNQSEILKYDSYNRDMKPEFNEDPNELITIRTHGTLAGRILNGTDYNPRHVAYIKPLTEGVKENFEKVSFVEFTSANAFVPSLSQAEIAWCYDNQPHTKEA